ncbi:MAG TPA: ABC transporter substrate-binding protein, partial [Prosthecobacter sp.]|nr:ABC transporter substrate-binding protein [Prosthecobacter sp.]
QNNEPVLRNDKALDFEATPARNRLLVLWNSRSPVLADLRVRQALALATDRRALVADLLEGRGRLVEGVFPPGTWLNQKLSAAAPDLAQAEKLLAEAGWFRDVSGVARSAQRALDIQFLITEGNPWRRRLAEALARQWTRIGARVTVTDVNAHEWIGERLRPGRFDAALLGMDFDLHWDQRLFWHSAGIEDGMNFAGIADAQLDLLLEALAAEYDPSRVAARAREMESRLLSLHAFIPLFGDLQQVAIRRRRFPDPPQNPAGLRLRDWLRQGPAQPSAPVEFQMIMPDE